MKRSLGPVLVLLAAAALAGCVGTVAQQSFPALAEQRAPIRRIAVVPLVVKAEDAADSAPVVARYLVDALTARGFEVAPPETVARASGGLDPAPALPELAAMLQREVGVDAVLVGRITRWVEREGSAAGAQRAASVGLAVDLYGAPGAKHLWRGEFNHTQQALSENLLLTPRYPGGGTRWLSAEEFAQFAASELAAALPLAP